MRNRPSKDDYYIGIAAQVAKRSTCIRRQYGAVIVKNDIIVATGYNGSPRGHKNCCDVGSCWRENNNIPHGQRYEECVAIHAEANALMSCSREQAIGATLYLAGFENGQPIRNPEPCKMCKRLIDNALIGKVVSGFSDDLGTSEHISTHRLPEKLNGYRCVCGGCDVYYSNRVKIIDHESNEAYTVHQLYCVDCGIMMRSSDDDNNGEWLKNRWIDIHMKRSKRT